MKIITDIIDAVYRVANEQIGQQSDNSGSVGDIVIEDSDTGDIINISVYVIGEGRIYILHDEELGDSVCQEVLDLLSSLRSIRTIETLDEVMSYDGTNWTYTPIKEKYILLDDYSHNPECMLTRVNDILVYNDGIYYNAVIHGGINTNLWLSDTVRVIAMSTFDVSDTYGMDAEVLITDRVNDRDQVRDVLEKVNKGIKTNLLPGLYLTTMAGDIVLMVSDNDDKPYDYGKTMSIMREYSLTVSNPLERILSETRQPITIN